MWISKCWRDDSHKNSCEFNPSNKNEPHGNKAILLSKSINKVLNFFISGMSLELKAGGTGCMRRAVLVRLLGLLQSFQKIV